MSDKVRVYEIAEEAGASSQEVINKAKDLGIELKSPQSAVSFEDAEEITNYIMTGKSSKIPSKTASKPKNNVEKVVKEEVVEKVVSNDEKTTDATEKKNVEVKKKPELKKVVISKPVSKAPLKAQEETDKLENQDNSNKVVPKRRGLVIIKKKKPREEEIKEASFDQDLLPKKQMKSLSEILGGNEEEKVSNDAYSLNNHEDSKK